jgi:LemA protein
MKKTNWKVVALIIVGVLAIALMCIFGVQEAQNKAIAFEEQVNTAQSDIKVQEKRRVDLVYNLAGCVKEYDKHEAETLTGIVEKRGSTGDIENVTTAITAVAEAYPELKSNENYKNLTKYERRKEIMPWICERQIENKYSNRYIPKIDNVPYTVFELNINGEYYKGTIEEIEEKSGTDISWIDRDKLADTISVQTKPTSQSRGVVIERKRY